MRRQVPIVVVIAALLLTTATACTSKPGPQESLDHFIALWNQGKTEGVAVIDPGGASLEPAGVLAAMKKLAGDLSLTKAAISTTKLDKGDNDATGTLKVDWTVADGVVWSYQTTAKLKKNGDFWRVVWTPEVLHPQIRANEALSLTGVAPARGSILDVTGDAIVKPRPVVKVGVHPKEIKNQAALIAALDAAFKSVNVDVDLADLPAQIANADPDAFVSVVTLRREVYEQIKPKIHDLDGTVFDEGMMPLAPTREFARALLGTVGEVTREQLDKNPGRYVIGDQVGQSGLQQLYDRTLRGTTGVKVRITGRTSNAGGSLEPVELFNADPHAGKSIQTTLDQKVQAAADKALAGTKLRSSLVAIRISDGTIAAVANGPGGGEQNLAFTASVPPGSTFKVITALGVLDKGSVTVDTPVPCPKTYTVEGRTFTNAGGFELGTVPFHTDFAKSCNTAFASLAGQLKPDLLAKAGATVGLGTAWNPGSEANTGKVPANVSDVEAAAAAFGQGQTLVSPLAMCGAVAAVARGSWIQPTLFNQLPEGAPKAGDGTAAPAKGAALKPASVSALKTMMREVVTGGTATGLASLGEVYAKTGTAEYDNNPANTHAWTVGWRGDIAFGVFVEKGGSSADTAVPIVATFLRNL